MEIMQKSTGEVRHFSIFIPTNTPSLKNSKVWTGRRLIPSKTVREYIKSSDKDYEENKEKWFKMIEGKSKPYFVGFHFYRKSKHKFDFINACQIVQDLMVQHGWIEDDNMDELIPVCIYYKDEHGTHGYTYDKENPGVEITILDI